MSAEARCPRCGSDELLELAYRHTRQPVAGLQPDGAARQYFACRDGDDIVVCGYACRSCTWEASARVDWAPLAGDVAHVRAALFMSSDDDTAPQRAQLPACDTGVVYLVSIRERCRAQGVRCEDPGHAIVTTRAVAALDEARAVVSYAIHAHRDHARTLDAARDRSPTMAAIRPAGGTIGPLADGTVIAVSVLSWRELSERVGLRRNGLEYERVAQQELIDAFNAGC